MLRTRTVGSLVVAATTLVVTPLSLPRAAEARGHHHGGVYVGVGFGGFYGWGPYWGWGWPGYWGYGWGWGPGPYSYGAPAGGALGYAIMSGMGALDVNVKPNKAEVWVDGKYVADARDLDGDPSYLWLKQGTHHIVVYKAGFRSFEQDVSIHTGVIRELKLTLEKGESQPPALAAPDARQEPPRPESTEPRPETAQPRVEAVEPAHGPQGELTLRVQPGDATVYVDGAYRGTARELRRLRLPAGHHRVELVRPGFQAVSRELEVEADRTSELAVALEKTGGWKY